MHLHLSKKDLINYYVSIGQIVSLQTNIIKEKENATFICEISESLEESQWPTPLSTNIHIDPIQSITYIEEENSLVEIHVSQVIQDKDTIIFPTFYGFESTKSDHLMTIDGHIYLEWIESELKSTHVPNSYFM